MGASAPGALADYVIVHKTQLAKIPAKVPFEIAALIEPLGIGLHAANLIQPKSAERAVIVGAGPIGLCLLKVLEKIGLTEIYLVDTLPYRVRFAKQLGATDAFLFKDAAEKLATLTEKEGAAYVFDTAGTQEAITLCGEVVGVGGTIGLIGIPTKDTIHYNPHRLRVKEVRIQNVRRSNQTLADCIKLFAEDKTLTKIVTHRFPLEKVQKGFELVSAQKDNVIKCIITND
jgi:L-iditol 2-dehydrogenase